MCANVRCKNSIPPTSVSEVWEEENSVSSEPLQRRRDQAITSKKRETDRANIYASVEQNVRTLQCSDKIPASVVKSHSIRTHIDLRFDHRMSSGCPQISTQGIFEYGSTKPYNFSSLKTNQPKVSVSTSTLQLTDLRATERAERREAYFSPKRHLGEENRKKTLEFAHIAAYF